MEFCFLQLSFTSAADLGPILCLVRAYWATEAYQKAMHKRKVWVEPLFGEGKQWHGMSRFRLRRLGKVNIEGLVRAAGQNIKWLLKHNGWKPRLSPAGGADLSYLVAPGLGLFQRPERFYVALYAALRFGLSSPPQQCSQFNRAWFRRDEAI